MVTEAPVEPGQNLASNVSASGAVTCALATSEFEGEWDRYVRSHQSATGYHLWGWRRVFEKGLGHRCHYVVARRADTIVGLVPLVEIRSVVFGRALSSLPYVNYGGALVDDRDTADALLAFASAIAKQRSLSYVLLRHIKRLLPELPARNHKVTMLLPLADTVDQMWNGLDRKVRNQVRKAEKSDLVVVSGGAELLDDFYTVFARNMHDLGTPVYGRPLFAAILSEFPSEARLHLVRLNGSTIAGALSYAFRNWIEVPSASSLREHRALCPNHLMYWSMLQQAIKDGRRVFDFGRSTPNDGTYNFKEQWGACPEQLWWEYALRGSTALPADDRHSRKYELAIEVWKRLPLRFANLVGPQLARQVP